MFFNANTTAEHLRGIKQAPNGCDSVMSVSDDGEFSFQLQHGLIDFIFSVSLLFTNYTYTFYFAFCKY